MAGRRRLKGGAPRLLGLHGGALGRAYRRGWDALAAEFDLRTPLLRLEAGRVAALWAQLEQATVNLAAAQQRRELERLRPGGKGLGRCPSPRHLERLARRQGLIDGSYGQALDKLRELAGRRKPLDLARAIQQAGPR